MSGSGEPLWEAARVGHPDRGHHGPGRAVDRERLAEDTIQTDLDEAVAQQFARALAGQSLAPPSTQQSVAEIGFARDFSLVGTVRRLKHPEADELPSMESDPETEPGDLLPGEHSALVSLLDF
jgi:hypothetical protein